MECRSLKSALNGGFILPFGSQRTNLAGKVAGSVLICANCSGVMMHNHHNHSVMGGLARKSMIVSSCVFEKARQKL